MFLIMFWGSWMNFPPRMIHWQSQEEHEEIIFLFWFASEKDTVEYLNELSYQKIMLHPKNLCFQPAIQWWDPVGMKAVSNHSLLSTFLFAIQIQVPNSMEGLSHETIISNFIWKIALPEDVLNFTNFYHPSSFIPVEYGFPTLESSIYGKYLRMKFQCFCGNGSWGYSDELFFSPNPLHQNLTGIG